MWVYRHQLHVDLPNEWNFAFNGRGVLVAYLVAAYALGAPTLYMHMLAQRRRRLRVKAD